MSSQGAILVLDLGLHHADGVRALHLQGGGLAIDSDEDLHYPVQRGMESGKSADRSRGCCRGGVQKASRC